MAVYLQDDFFFGVAYLLVSSGKQYLLSPSPDNRLLLQEGTGSAWEKPRLLPLLQEGFAAALDNNRIPHLVSVEQGNFYHLVVSGKGKEESPTLFYREKNRQCRHLLMAGDHQGVLHLIHPAVDRFAERWWLMHHRYSGDTWEEPRVIDFGPGSRKIHSALTIDDCDCLHLLYCSNSAGQPGLYYRQFDPDTNSWSKPDITSTSPSATYPFLVADRNRNLHLLWSAPVENKHYVYYCFRGGPDWKSRGWTPDMVISPAMAEPPFPFFSFQSGELFIAWLKNKTLFRYRFSENQWNQIAEQQFEKPQLLRCCSFSLEGSPLYYWLAVEIGKAARGNLHDALLPVIDCDDLGGDISKLQQYSGKLIGRIENLSASKKRLQEEVQSKDKKMRLFSQQSEKQILSIQKKLQSREAELQKYQQDFTCIVDNLKKKVEQGRQTREAERKRFRSALEESKMECRQLENNLQEKERVIADLEKTNREQLAQIEQLKNEIATLKPKPRTGWSGLKRFWKK